MYQCERRDCVRWFEFDSIEDPIVWYYSSKVHQTHKQLSIPNKGNCNSILIRNPLKWRWHFRAKLFSCPPHPSILFEKKSKITHFGIIWEFLTHFSSRDNIWTWNLDIWLTSKLKSVRIAMDQYIIRVIFIDHCCNVRRWSYIISVLSALNVKKSNEIIHW